MFIFSLKRCCERLELPLTLSSNWLSAETETVDDEAAQEAVKVVEEVVENVKETLYVVKETIEKKLRRYK